MARSRNDRSIKPLIAFVLLVAQVLSVVPALAADDGQIAGAVAPNVVILLDTSTRLADSVPSNPYVRTRIYPVQRRCLSASRKGKPAPTQPCASGAIYKGPTYTPVADSTSALMRGEAAVAKEALVESGYWRGSLQGANTTLYTGNYINFLLGSCANGGACPQPKMAGLKRAVSAVLNTHRGVRFGIMTSHQGPSSGRVVAAVGTGAPAINSALLAVIPGHDAPLGDALHDAGRYFKGEPLLNGAIFPSPILGACQANHIIVVSDAGGGQTPGARALGAEAALRREQDHSAILAGAQRVIVHTIAFGMAPSSAADVGSIALKEAADNGGGGYLQAENATELEASLRATLARITQVTYSFANPVVSRSTTTGSRRAYLAAFEPTAATPFWPGSLRAYEGDAMGAIPVDAEGVPLASALVWDAALSLSSMPSGRRTIYTETAGNLTPFTRANLRITSAMLGVATAEARNRVIDFVRGVDVNGEPRARGGPHDRTRKLGAIVHSTPVLVSAPVLTLSDPTYQAFKAAQAKRAKVVLVGADDGMLHAFRESDGRELWAFIPSDLLGRLADLTGADRPHAPFVDGSPVAVDIKAAGAWRTVVMFGCRDGCAAYHALDVTDTTSPKFLWRFGDPKIHATSSLPAIGRLKIRGIDTYVAFVGGGGGSEDAAYGKAFFAIDVATGTKIWEYSSVSASTDDRRHMTFSVPANPTVVDADHDGYVDHVYVGDTGGQLWKFDVAAAEPSAWKGKRIFAPATTDDVRPHAIETAPVIALDHHRKRWVFFAAGASKNPGATWSSRFYALKDDTDMTNGAAVGVDAAGIKDVTSASGPASRGWYVLLGPSEKILAQPNVFNETVFFTSFTPDRAEACGPGAGTAKLYALQAWSGRAAIDFNTGARLSQTAATASRFKAIGRGVVAAPVVVMMPPVVPGTPSLSSVFTTTSSGQLFNTVVPPPPFLKQLKSWRERSP